MRTATHNLSRLLSQTASRYPDRTAIVFGGDRISYASLDAASSQVANLLVSRGIEPGDKVALSCPNLPHFTTIYYGILKAGATVVPLNVLLKAREVAYHLADSNAKVYFAFEGSCGAADRRRRVGGIPGDRELHRLLPDRDRWRIRGRDPRAASPTPQSSPSSPRRSPTVERDEDDTAVILYTSGTTGQPKGAELRHRNMRRQRPGRRRPVRRRPAERPDTYLCALPLFHSFGQTVIQNGAIAFGGTIVMQPRFEAQDALRLMLANDVTFFAGVPTMYWGLLGALDETVDVARLAANLRVAVAGGSALPAEIHKQFKDRFGSRSSRDTACRRPRRSRPSPGTARSPGSGRSALPIPGVEMKLVNDDWSDVKDGPDEVGEIAIKGHNVMKGYHNRPEATDWAIKDGWFRSGDLARKDEDGFYYIVDRSKDMIIRGGYNVYPRELEEVLMQHPAVSLVAVIGVPHESHGEEIKAVVVKSAGDTTTEDELRAWGEQHFAAYKYPRIVQFVGQLPLASTGKILKRQLS